MHLVLKKTYIPIDNRTSPLHSSITSQNGDRTSGTEEKDPLNQDNIGSPMDRAGSRILTGKIKSVSARVTGTPWDAGVIGLCQ